MMLLSHGLFRRIAVIFLMLFGLSAILPLAASAQGISEDAHLCQQGGYLNYTDADGNGFENTGQCVSYAARGGTLVPVPVTDLSLEGGVISGTGFTPNVTVDVLVWVYSPFATTFMPLPGAVDATGAFSIPRFPLCGLGTYTMITAIDAANVAHTETFDLVSSCA